MLDCVIIGGGAAGLVAATYLARYRRDFVLIDAGASRLRRIPRARNAPGYPDGVEGGELHDRLRRQAVVNGARLIDGRVTEIHRRAGGFSVVTADDAHEARTVLLATGTVLVEPDIDNIDGAICRGVVRYCPICDGFEAQGRSIAVLGGTENALDEARFLRAYSDRIFYIPASVNARLSSRQEAIASAHGIRWARNAATAIRVVDDGVCVAFEQKREVFDILYPCLGATPQSSFASGLGAIVTETGGVLTDHHQRTQASGVYAAGDVLEGVDQIASAFGQAAIAATAIHNDLDDAESSSAEILGRR